MKHHVHILIKPASSACNMRCKYCFYCDVSLHRGTHSFGTMNENTMKSLVRKTLEYADGGNVTYAFQGGEPLLAGELFFHTFAETVDEFNVKGSPIRYALQTNGTLLTDCLCVFLKQKNFLVGVSLDGPRKLNDVNRISADGSASFDAIMNGIALLKKHGIPFNILTVLTHTSVDYLSRLKTFFENCNFSHLQFISCLEPFGTEPFSTELAMSPDEYYMVYKSLFDWYLEQNRNGRLLSIRHFDNMLNTLQGRSPELCGTLGYCPGQLVIEGNGNCYPCDFYCDDKHLLGNIQECSLDEMHSDPVMKQFIDESLTIDTACKKCPVLSLCRGGCRRERDWSCSGHLGLNIYCSGRKKFFEYVISTFSKT